MRHQLATPRGVAFSALPQAQSCRGPRAPPKAFHVPYLCVPDLDERAARRAGRPARAGVASVAVTAERLAAEGLVGASTTDAACSMLQLTSLASLDAVRFRRHRTKEPTATAAAHPANTWCVAAGAESHRRKCTTRSKLGTHQRWQRLQQLRLQAHQGLNHCSVPVPTERTAISLS